MNSDDHSQNLSRRDLDPGTPLTPQDYRQETRQAYQLKVASFPSWASANTRVASCNDLYLS